jgi:hypothetical protein
MRCKRLCKWQARQVRACQWSQQQQRDSRELRWRRRTQTRHLKKRNCGNKVLTSTASATASSRAHPRPCFVVSRKKADKGKRTKGKRIMPNCFNNCELTYFVFNTCAVANDATSSATCRRDAGAGQYCKRAVAREVAVAALCDMHAGAFVRRAWGGAVPSCQERRTAMCSHHEAKL